MKLATSTLFSLTAASLGFSHGLEMSRNQGHLRKLLAADSNFTGCIEAKGGSTANGTPLILGDCSVYQNGIAEEVLADGTVRFTSRRNRRMCVQAGKTKSTLKSLDTIKLYECSDTNVLQKFKWCSDGLHTAYKSDLCVIFDGNAPNVGKDPIIVKDCKRLPSDFGWSED